MRKLSVKELKNLLHFYQRKMRQARSGDKVKAYSKCVDQIGQFLYEGQVYGLPDIFTWSWIVGETDVRVFIRNYLSGSVKTDEELARDEVIKHFESRNVLYTGVYTPSDEVIREMFRSIVVEQLPDMDRAAEVFTEYYDIEPVEMKLVANYDEGDYGSSDGGGGVVFYDFGDKIIFVNPAQIQARPQLLYAVLLGLFEHMCAEKSWRFVTTGGAEEDAGREECLAKQSEETTRFVERFFSRCTYIRLLPPL